jgi:hypothetical protein
VKPNVGVDDVAAPPGVDPALPNNPPAGFGVSPSFLCPKADPKPPPNPGVDDAPAVG